jgi:hypothetical protein
MPPLPKRFTPNDFWLLLWLIVCVLIVYLFAEPAIHDRSLGRAIIGIGLGCFFVGPLFVLAYLRWFRKN